MQREDLRHRSDVPYLKKIRDNSACVYSCYRGVTRHALLKSARKENDRSNGDGLCLKLETVAELEMKGVSVYHAISQP